MEQKSCVEIHDIGEDASSFVCQIYNADFGSICALNEDGSEVAFVSRRDDKVQIVEVDKFTDAESDQLKIITPKMPAPAAQVYQLVYADGGRLYIGHRGGQVSVVDPATKAATILEPSAPKGVIATISPSADYIALVEEHKECVDPGKDYNYRATVKGRLGSSVWGLLFGYHDPVHYTKGSDGFIKCIPAPAPLSRLSMKRGVPSSRLLKEPDRTGWGAFYAFDGTLRYRYEISDDFVIRREGINSGDNRGLIKLPASDIEGVPQHLQTDSEGTVFYLGTSSGTKRRIYVIDIANKRIYAYYLKHLKSDIDRIDVHADGAVLVMALRNGQKFIFSCENRKTLCLLNALAREQRLIAINRHVAVFEEGAAARTRIGYIDLTKANASLKYLSRQGAASVALHRDNVCLIDSSAKSIVCLNVTTNETTTVKKGQYGTGSFSQADGIIRTISHNFIYQVLDAKTARQLYAIRLPSIFRQKDKSPTLISSDGQRVLVQRHHTLCIFEISDPDFSRKMQAAKESTRARRVEKASFLSKMGLENNDSFFEQHLRPTE